jgi:hypothetical protein
VQIHSKKITIIKKTKTPSIMIRIQREKYSIFNRKGERYLSETAPRKTPNTSGNINNSQ